MDTGGALQPILPVNRIAMPEQRFETLYDRLGHRFSRPELLQEALTHPSVGRSAKRAGGNYERMEFLGDRVLGLTIAAFLFEKYPDAETGEMARRYNALVRRETLAEIAREFGLGEFLIMAAGERDTGGADKPAILADSCEAVIAALYLDGGFDVARDFVLKYWLDRAEDPAAAPKDAKTALQEWAHKADKGRPVYVVVSEEGPPHEPVFTVEARIDSLPPTRGVGSSKRIAEQAAAQAMLDTLS